MKATITLDGEALAWFQWEDGRRPRDLKCRLIDRFQHTQEETLCEQFLSLRQEDSVKEYLSTFEMLAATMENMPLHIQESTFINGLKPEIRANVRMMKAEGLAKGDEIHAKSGGEKCIQLKQQGKPMRGPTQLIPHSNPFSSI